MELLWKDNAIQTIQFAKKQNDTWRFCRRKQLQNNFWRGSYQHDTINTYARNVEVFNSDYIKDNLKWEFDDNINAISFEVGESIEIREKIDKNLAEIAAIQGTEDVIGKRQNMKKWFTNTTNLKPFIPMKQNG